jgi:hypothetical protein
VSSCGDRKRTDEGDNPGVVRSSTIASAAILGTIEEQPPGQGAGRPVLERQHDVEPAHRRRDMEIGLGAI